jgi:hypothetical protein
MQLRLGQPTPTIEYSVADIAAVQLTLSGIFNSLSQLHFESRDSTTLQTASVNLNRITEIASLLKLHIYKDREP